MQDETIPTTRAEARARLVAIDDRIAAIRTQIAANDLQRQANRKASDASWFHRAKTALRHLQRERAELLERMTLLPRPKEALKDQIIAELRERYDDAGWADVIDAAHRRLEREVA